MLLNHSLDDRFLVKLSIHAVVLNITDDFSSAGLDL